VYQLAITLEIQIPGKACSFGQQFLNDRLNVSGEALSELSILVPGRIHAFDRIFAIGHKSQRDELGHHFA
jgi:hypothetical protein